VTTTACPLCKAPGPDADDLSASEDEQSLLTCAHCGFIGIWDADRAAWRSLTSEEHAEMMQHEGFLVALEYGLAYRAWRERDQRVMTEILSERFGQRADAIADAVRALGVAGFHTHPSADDAAALGLDKFEGHL